MNAPHQLGGNHILRVAVRLNGAVVHHERLISKEKRLVRLMS